MPKRISTSQVITQQAKGVATGFVSDLAGTLVGNLFRRKQPQSNILSRRDSQTRLATIRSSLYTSNENYIPSSADVIRSSLTGTYASQNYSIENLQKVGRGVKQPVADFRVRLDLGTGNRTFLENFVMQPLVDTKGVVFPHTPQLVVTHNANYIPTPITHANFQHYTYSNSDIAAIQIAGDFSVQNENEGLYLLAVIHFFRTVTKMYFGSSSSAPSGTPPPILFLSAHGSQLFDRVPVVVTSFVSTFPPDVNYLYIGADGDDTGSTAEARVPTLMNLSVTVQPVFNRRQAKTFSLDQFAAGKLLSRGYI